MKRLLNFLLERGKLKNWAEISLGLTGAAIVLLTLEFASHKVVFIAGIILGVVLISIASVSAKATVLGLKPFTNDPLGWRAAKKTYDKTDMPPDASKPTSEDSKAQ